MSGYIEYTKYQSLVRLLIIQFHYLTQSNNLFNLIQHKLDEPANDEQNLCFVKCYETAWAELNTVYINPTGSSILYHAIENKAIQNTEKPLYIILTVLHLTFPLCVVHVTLTALGTVFSMAWSKIVMRRSLVVNHGMSHLSLVFSWSTHSPKGLCVY